jgi:O-antigen/teichoic acid export membrane protein
VNYIWLTLVSIIYILIGEFILELLFSKKYLEATPLILPLVIANFFMGASQPYNFFLSAKGKGDYLQKIALSFSFYTIILNLLLIPLYKAMGAAIATLISVILNFISYRYYYKKSIKE